MLARMIAKPPKMTKNVASARLCKPMKSGEVVSVTKKVIILKRERILGIFPFLTISMTTADRGRRGLEKRPRKSSLSLSRIRFYRHDGTTFQIKHLPRSDMDTAMTTHNHLTPFLG